MSSPTPLIDVLSASRRRVLLVIEDPSLGEILEEALESVGHHPERVEDAGGLAASLARSTFDAAVVDVDNRARDGVRLVAMIRAAAPATTVIALLPCGGLLPGAPAVAYHLSLEKPTRLLALLTALAAGP